jgi:hypothetical protein
VKTREKWWKIFATGEKSYTCTGTLIFSDNPLKITALQLETRTISAALGEMLQTGFISLLFSSVLWAEKKIYPVPSDTSRYEAVRYQGLPRCF